MDTLEWLGRPRTLTELRFVVAERERDRPHILQVADLVEKRLQDAGVLVNSTRVPLPGRLVYDDNVEPLLLILGVMGVLSLLLSISLVTNTVLAILTEQTRQMGIMKALGARRGQLVLMYLSLVAAYGLLALLLALPLGVLGARGFVLYAASILNFDIPDWTFPPSVLALEVAAGLLVPLFAAVVPVLRSTRRPVREALTDYGVSRNASRPGRIGRALFRVRGLPRPVLLSLRNSLRQKARLLRTLITLILAGTLFIGVTSVYSSLMYTLDAALAYYDFDVRLFLDREQRSRAATQLALQVPGVVEAEAWRSTGAKVKRAETDVGPAHVLYGLPTGSDFVAPSVVEGRWLVPEDENAVVVTTALKAYEGNIAVGQKLTLVIDGRDSTWRVVGVVRSPLSLRAFYTNYNYLANVLGEAGWASEVVVRTSQHHGAFQDGIARALRDQFEVRGMGVSTLETMSQFRAFFKSQFDILVGFLLGMSLLVAVVGGLGLAGMVSINVLERTREIGVMRAIGATSRTILSITIAEGLLVGLGSWVVSTLLAVPFSQVLSDGVGIAFMGAPLQYDFSVVGTALWLGIVLGLAGLAGAPPAWRASQINVRAALTYD